MLTGQVQGAWKFESLNWIADLFVRKPWFHLDGGGLLEGDLKIADGQLAAGVRDFGQGRLLFVNLPLGYLKVRTDGLLMHGMLRYFATELIGLPTLSAVPEGVGGMTLNWHCDARPCESATRKLICRLPVPGVAPVSKGAPSPLAGPRIQSWITCSS